MFHELHNWLLDRTLREGVLTEVVQELGVKLCNGGIPITRMNVGGILLHPVLGALDITWDAKSGHCQSQTIPRSAVHSPEFQNAPFYKLVTNNIPFEQYKLDNPETCRKYPLLERLSKEGVTDYIAMFESYGRTTSMEWAGLPAGVEGATFSFSTDRISGFSDQEIQHLKELILPFALFVKGATERNLATALLDTYLGKLSGANVLAGLMERGDGRLIECALWRSDLRGSTSMAAEMDIESYFGAINDYFDCTAAAVLDHGGEVLKFIGDAVMAIFPFESETGTPSEMCNAAVVTARDSLSRGVLKNKQREDMGLAPINFGIGLHTGKVMFGNVGTERRLDLTVTGPAANEVDRLESLCKRLSVPVIVSHQFKQVLQAELMPLGRHEVAGVENGLEAYTMPEYLPNTSTDTE